MLLTVSVHQLALIDDCGIEIKSFLWNKGQNEAPLSYIPCRVNAKLFQRPHTYSTSHPIEIKLLDHHKMLTLEHHRFLCGFGKQQKYTKLWTSNLYYSYSRRFIKWESKVKKGRVGQKLTMWNKSQLKNYWHFVGVIFKSHKIQINLQTISTWICINLLVPEEYS